MEMYPVEPSLWPVQNLSKSFYPRKNQQHVSSSFCSPQVFYRMMIFAIIGASLMFVPGSGQVGFCYALLIERSPS